MDVALPQSFLKKSSAWVVAASSRFRLSWAPPLLEAELPGSRAPISTALKAYAM